jgi:predicted signal transduction protein with EAL and GGDEF domain
VAHHKTGTVAPHPLEEVTEEGVVQFYADAEEVLAKLPKLGVPMILRDLGDGKAKLWRYSSLNHVVTRLRRKLGLPEYFTLDACRHGGLTELKEAELTDGQGRALSTHKTQQSYEGYAKRTAKRMLSATRKRYAHRLANETATSIQNEATDSVQNAKRGFTKSA